MDLSSTRVTGGVVRCGPKAILDGVSLTARSGEVLVILGPGGAGKSTLLAALSGRPLADGLERQGEWLSHVAPQQVFVLTQPRDGRRKLVIPGEAIPRLPLLLLDEPYTGSLAAERAELAAVVRERARAGSAVVVVTHDLALARLAADRAILLVGGLLVADLPAAEFFASQSPLVARFVAQGNVSLPPAPPALPSHFRWILPGRLAGLGRPGLLSDEEHDLEAIAAAGIEVLVAVEETPIAASRLRSFGLEGWHLPIRDMGVPAMGPLVRLCRDIDRLLEAGRPVAVHCRAGLGRTGVVLAATLVFQGLEPSAAIAKLRATGRGYVQNRAQEQFVERFAAEIGRAC